MISRSELIRKLKRSVGDQIFKLINQSLIDEVLQDETLLTFSDYYPLLVDITITKDCAIPYTSYSGINFNYMKYKLPELSDFRPLAQNEIFEWRDIENYYITGNDSSDVYSGGNFLMNQFFISARSTMPHTRSYFEVTFEEPNILILNPPQQTHRNFTVRMQSKRTLSTVLKNMQSIFMNLFVADMKIALYNKYQHETGNQIYGGIEIETKIENFADAVGDREKIIDIFEGDWMKNPERFEVINLYNNK